MMRKSTFLLSLTVIIVGGVLLILRRPTPLSGPQVLVRETASSGTGQRERDLKEWRETEEEARRLEIRIVELRAQLEAADLPAVPDVVDKWARFAEFDQARSRVQRAHSRRTELENVDHQLALTADQRRAVGEILERRDERLLVILDEGSSQELEQEESRAQQQIRDLLSSEQRAKLDKEKDDPRANWEKYFTIIQANLLELDAEQREALKTPLFELDEEFYKVRNESWNRLARGRISYQDYREALEKAVDAGIGRVRNRMTAAQLTRLRQEYRIY